MSALQEWLKLGDDFIEDVFVCVGQKRADNRTTGSTTLAERYIKHEIGLEVHYISYGKGSQCYFVAIFKAARVADLKRLQKIPASLYADTAASHCSSHQSWRAMFVRIPHTVKNVKRARPIASIMRLFIRNPVLDFDWKALNLWRVPGQKLGFSFVELEAKVVGGISRFSQPKHKAVHGGSKVMNGISRTKSKCSQRLFVDLHFKGNKPHIPFSLHLSDYCIWPRTLRKKIVGLNYEFIDAMPCPIEPGLGKLHIFRMGVTHEWKKRKSEHSKGRRDTNPETRRLLQESEESRHAVSVPSKEEVTAQTAPSHLRGGYTATRTRSNNPEDVS
jgi:hypothetical protein